MVDSISVKIGSCKTLRGGSDVFCKLRIGSDHRQSRVSKKSSNYFLNELFTLKTEGDKQLIVEVWKSSMLKKSCLGQVAIEVSSPSSEQWYRLVKAKDKEPKARGEIQITVDHVGMKSPRARKGPDLKELGMDFAIDSKPKAIPDPSTFAKELTIEQIRVTTNNYDLGVLNLSTIKTDIGTVFFEWQSSNTKFQLHLPRTFTANRNFLQGPWVRCHLHYDKLKLRGCYRVKVVTTEDEQNPQYVVGNLEAKAISEENKNVETIKACFKVDNERVKKIIKEDELYESVPDYNENELISASFKGLIDKVQACLNRWDDVNQKDDDDETPLHKAVTNGNADVIRLLVERGADPRATNRYGLSPVDFAEKYFKKDLIPLMRTYQ